jgi:hypothetical protein
MSDKSHTDLGTSEIHKRHRVMIEGGQMPRARVMDQTVVDRMLMEGLLTLQQHQAAEYLMNQASRAGLYTKSVNYKDMNSGGERVSDALANEDLMRYGRTLRLVERRYGAYHKYLVEEVVIHNWDITGDEKKMGVLREGLEWIADRRMAGGRNPMRHIRK